MADEIKEEVLKTLGADIDRIFAFMQQMADVSIAGDPEKITDFPTRPFTAKGEGDSFRVYMFSPELELLLFVPAIGFEEMKEKIFSIFGRYPLGKEDCVASFKEIAGTHRQMAKKLKSGEHVLEDIFSVFILAGESTPLLRDIGATAAVRLAVSLADLHVLDPLGESIYLSAKARSGNPGR
jgi:hypothetical protein